MEHRKFFVALGVPHGADPGQVQTAYRKLVTRYRTPEEPAASEQREGEPFHVLRSYSERRHATLMEQETPALPEETGEVDRFFGGFVPEVIDAPARATPDGKDLYVELRLSHAEARMGGLQSVHIPVLRRCPACKEQEEKERLVCKACAGRGQVSEDHLIEVTVPPRVKAGQRASVAMEDVGLGATTLLVYVSVGD